MSGTEKLCEIALLNGWPDELLQKVWVLLASEWNDSFEKGKQVERRRWIKSGFIEDAARYQWIRAQKGLDLRSEKEGQKWTRADGSVFYPTHSLSVGGTQVAAAESLDAMIDSAMAEAGE